MQKYVFGGYQAEVDPSATMAWYASAAEWGCRCGHCKNFLALAKNQKLPTPVMETLNELGIPPEKATYVCEIYTNDKGIHYQFSYRVAGTILKSPDNDGVFGIEVRCCHELYPYGAPNFPEPHFDLEFWTVLPWVLDTPAME